MVTKPIGQTCSALKQLKNILRICHNMEDDFLESSIDSAIRVFENKAKTSIIKKNYRYFYKNNRFTSEKAIVLPVSPVCSIISVESVDAEQKTSLSYKDVSIGGNTVIFVNSKSDSIEVNYEAGLADSKDEIPPDILDVVIYIAKHIYEGYPSSGLDLSLFNHLITKHKRFSLI